MSITFGGGAAEADREGGQEGGGQWGGGISTRLEGGDGEDGQEGGRQRVGGISQHLTEDGWWGRREEWTGRKGRGGGNGERNFTDEMPVWRYFSRAMAGGTQLVFHKSGFFKNLICIGCWCGHRTNRK